MYTKNTSNKTLVRNIGARLPVRRFRLSTIAFTKNNISQEERFVYKLFTTEEYTDVFVWGKFCKGRKPYNRHAAAALPHETTLSLSSSCSFSLETFPAKYRAVENAEETARRGQEVGQRGVPIATFSRETRKKLEASY